MVLLSCTFLTRCIFSDLLSPPFQQVTYTSMVFWLTYEASVQWLLDRGTCVPAWSWRNSTLLCSWRLRVNVVAGYKWAPFQFLKFVKVRICSKSHIISSVLWSSYSEDLSGTFPVTKTLSNPFTIVPTLKATLWEFSSRWGVLTRRYVTVCVHL